MQGIVRFPDVRHLVCETDPETWVDHDTDVAFSLHQPPQVSVLDQGMLSCAGWQRDIPPTYP